MRSTSSTQIQDVINEQVQDVLHRIDAAVRSGNQNYVDRSVDRPVNTFRWLLDLLTVHIGATIDSECEVWPEIIRKITLSDKTDEILGGVVKNNIGILRDIRNNESNEQLRWICNFLIILYTDDW